MYVTSFDVHKLSESTVNEGETTVKNKKEQEETIVALQEEVKGLREKNAKLGEVLKQFAQQREQIDAKNAEALTYLNSLKEQISTAEKQLETVRSAEDIRLEKLREKAEKEANSLVETVTNEMDEKKIKFDQQISARQKSIYAKTYNTLNGVNNRHAEYIKDIKFQQGILTETYETVLKKLSQEENQLSPQDLFDRELSVVYSRRAKLARKQGKSSMLGVKELLSSEETVTMEFIDVSELESLGDTGLRNNVLVGRVVLPEGLKQLPANFFFGCLNLREVVIPSTLERIREFAFYGCTNLKFVQIKSNVLKRIDDYAFSLCENMDEFSMPDSVERIGTAVFRHCTSLKRCAISRNSNLTKLGTHAFQYCSMLREFDIPPGVRELPLSVFYGCDNLRSLAIPKTVASVGKYAVHGCSALKRVVICNDSIDINATFGYLSDCEFIRAKQ